MKRSVERKRAGQGWMRSECWCRHGLGQHHAVPLHPSLAVGRAGPSVRWWVKPGASRRSSLDQQEMRSRTRLDKATQRVTLRSILGMPTAQVQGPPVSEAGPWEMEQGTNTSVPCPKHLLGAQG